MTHSWSANTPLSRRALLAVVALLGVSAIAIYDTGGNRTIDARGADAMTPGHLKPFIGTNFGTLFTLRGLSMQCEGDGLHLRIAWQSNTAQAAPFTTAVHLIDAPGNIVAQADHRQALGTPVSSPGSIRVDTQVIAPDQFKEGIVGLALGLFDDGVNLLPIDRGPRDWGDRRLIVPVARCVGATSKHAP